MLYLKEANRKDVEKEFEAISRMPFYENGFGNSFAFMSREEFLGEGIEKMIGYKDESRLSKDRVPETYFFLWDDDRIVGLFKIRHCLNEELRKGAGHIGFGILEEYRGKGYATRGLALAKEICRDLIEEDEIYLACYTDNKASLSVQLANGACIAGQDAECTYTRIPLR